jgi:hypothetical protein
LGRQLFDVIIVVGVLSSIPLRAHRSELMRHLTRFLSKKGSLVVGDFEGTDAYRERYEPQAIEPCMFRTNNDLWIRHLTSEELVSHIPRRLSVKQYRCAHCVSLNGNALKAHLFTAA